MLMFSFAASAVAREPQAPTVMPAKAPAGTEALGVEWIRIATRDSGTMLAAVARPQGSGPFPAIVILHGSHGFAQEYVRFAQAIARNGFIAIAPCWFSDGGGPGARFVTPIACPGAPPRPEAASAAAQQTVDALLQAVRALPDVHADRVALFGHSRGAGTALNYVLRHDTVQAAVLCSSGYPGELSTSATKLKTPILILHGVADGPADGGSELTNVKMARAFEAALHRLHKPVEAKYYETGGHNGLFVHPDQFDDEVRQVSAFLNRHLR